MPVPREPNPSLTSLRDRLEEIDRAIVLLVAARVEAAGLAIAVRSQADGSLTDPAQEEVVVHRARRWAEQQGLTPALVESVFRMMIEAGKARSVIPLRSPTKAAAPSPT